MEPVTGIGVCLGLVLIGITKKISDKHTKELIPQDTKSRGYLRRKVKGKLLTERLSSGRK